MKHTLNPPFRISAMIVVMALAAVSCGPRPLILDTDWWTDVDDAMAIRLALAADEKRQIRLEGICVDAVRETSIPSLRAFLQMEGRGDIALGADFEAADYNGTPCYHDFLIGACADASGAPAMPCVEFYRGLLSHSLRKVDIVAVGYPNALAQLLAADPDLVRRKVRHLWMMAGKYPDGTENNFTRTARSREAGAAMMDGWPTPVTFLGFEVGCDVLCGASLDRADILHRVIRLHQKSGVRSSWDPLTMWMAVAGSPEACGFSTVSGRCEVDALTGANRFVPAPDAADRGSRRHAGQAPHRYVVAEHEPQWYAARLDAMLRKDVAQKPFHANHVIAHRGAWLHTGHPQNSLASFRAAAEMGCHGSECDVWFTAEDSLVIFHDAKRFGKAIEDTPYEELRAVPLANGEPIPTLREYIAAAREQTGTKLIIDIKTMREDERTIELALATDRVVHEMGIDDMTEYLGGCLPMVELMMKESDVPIAYLGRWQQDLPECSPESVRSRGLTHLDYEDQQYKKHLEWIEEFKSMGCHLNAWAINSEEDILWCLRCGFDYITTNEPELVLELEKRQR